MVKQKQCYMITINMLTILFLGGQGTAYALGHVLLIFSYPSNIQGTKFIANTKTPTLDKLLMMKKVGR